jgi:hypothetical protein
MELKDLISIAAVIIGSGGILGTSLKVFFDWRTLKVRAKQRVRETLLTTVIRYTESYYLSMLCSADGLAYQLKQKGAENLAFLYLCRYVGCLHQVAKDMPGYFLATWAGEAIVKRLEDEIYNSFTKREDCLTAINWNQMAMTNPRVLWVEFLPQLKIEPLKDVFERFCSWMKDPDIVQQTTVYLSCYIRFLEYEINKVLKEWYGREAKLLLSQAEKKQMNELINTMINENELSRDEAIKIRKLVDRG